MKINKNNVDEFMIIAENIVNKTREESGCITYNLFKSLYSKIDEFIFYEVYKNEEELKSHMESQHLSDFLSAISSFLISEPEIEIHSI